MRHFRGPGRLARVIACFNADFIGGFRAFMMLKLFLCFQNGIYVNIQFINPCGISCCNLFADDVDEKDPS